MDSSITMELLFSHHSRIISTASDVKPNEVHLNETATLILDLSSVLTNNVSTLDRKLSLTNNLLNGYNLLSLLLLFFVTSGALGNILVCLAICRDRRLQNVTNYFLMSLAVADLLVCLVVMPFGIVDLLFGYWPFGPSTCNVWVTCDVLGCTSSIIHMCFISLGRYLGIRNPLKTHRRSKKVALTKIAIVWLVSMAITSPITVLGIIDTENIQPNTQVCAINNRFFFIFGSLSAFYIPMIVMVTSYVLTVRLLQQKARFCTDKPSRRVPFIRRSERYLLQHSERSRTTSVECSKCDRYGSSQTQERSDESTFRDDHQRERCENYDNSLKRQPHIKFKVISGMICILGSRSHVMNEQKATKVLGIVFFCFVICWTPFFTLNILFPIMDPTTFSDYLTTTFLWLGYVSSTINPIIYTIFNKTFRRAFWRLLSCTCCLTNIRSPINEMVMWPTSSKRFANVAHSPPPNHTGSM